MKKTSQLFQEEVRYSRLKRIKNRLKGLQTEKEIYEYILGHVGEKVMKTKLMRQFGFAVYGSDAENFIRTRLAKYMWSTPYPTKQKGSHGNYIVKYKRYIKNVIWLPKDLVNQHKMTTVATRVPRWGHRLCYKETIPFWLLKEYGGPYTGREFITEIDRRIKDSNEEVDEIKSQLIEPTK